jgi:hypothetical protein
MTTLTFIIQTYLPSRHPGVVQIQGRLGNSYHDVGGYDGIYLWEQCSEEKGAAYHIAEAIYDEETRLRQSTHHSGARFDFSSACTLHFFQKRESDSDTGQSHEASDDGSKKATRKQLIGSLSLEGGLSREMICQSIAKTILSGVELRLLSPAAK